MRATKDWFALLPEPYRSQAVENATIRGTLNRLADDMSDALDAFFLSTSTQGRDYWEDVDNKFKHLTFPAEEEIEAYVNLYKDKVNGVLAGRVVFGNIEDCKSSADGISDYLGTYRLTKVEK
jgi:hypothetical protein